MKHLFLLLLFFVLCTSVLAPPTPHNVRGFVVYANGTGVENGFPVLVNDTTANTSARTEVFAPPVPQFAGAYSATISGEDGDFVLVYSWNDTHYGVGNGTLQSTTRIDVNISLTRTPELNVTIVAPPDNSTFNGSQEFNLTVNVTLLGADADCNVTLSFGNTTVLNETDGNLTREFMLARGASLQVNFTLVGFALGFSSVTATGTCDPIGVILEASPVDVLQNITIVDEEPPVVLLMSPPNNTLNKTSNLINFTYNVSDFSPIGNCSLILNGAVNTTDLVVVRNSPENFTLTLPNGQYNWSVNCTDSEGNIGSSVVYNLTVEVLPPNVTATIISSIVLNAGTTRLVECNLTVVDLDGEANIQNGSATFFAITNISSDPDDLNGHYTNSSCAQTAASGIEKNFTCTFPVQYFAVNGTWFCNGTSFDAEGLSDFDNVSTVVDPLYALNITDTLMDFGDVQGDGTSANISQNISNIGNLPINVTVYGYGRVIGDGNAFGCDVDNVTIDNMRFAANITAGFSQKEALASTAKQLRLNIPKQLATATVSQNTSYWQVFIPRNVSDVGTCNGTIVFHAELG